MSYAIPNEALNFTCRPGSKVKKESVVNAAEHEAVGHALYGQAAHLQRLRSVAVETLEIPTQLRKARV